MDTPLLLTRCFCPDSFDLFVAFKSQPIPSERFPYDAVEPKAFLVVFVVRHYPVL